MVERNMCNAVMRGIVVPPGSRTTSRANRRQGARARDRFRCERNEEPTKIDGQRPGSREASARLLRRSRAGVKAVFNVTAMERSILAELSERGGRGQLSRFKDRRPIERSSAIYPDPR